MSKTQAVVALGVLAFLAVGAGIIGLIVSRGGDPDQIVRFLSNSALPIAVGLVTLSRVNSSDDKNSKTAEQVQNVAETMDTVKQQTNGALSRILDRLDALERNESTTPADHGDTR